MKNEKSNSGKKEINFEAAVNPVMDEPATPEEMVNKYGTYQIQPTAQAENAFPTIAHGFPKNGKIKQVHALVKNKRKDSPGEE